jgi:hypothetical protein
LVGNSIVATDCSDRGCHRRLAVVPTATTDKRPEREVNQFDSLKRGVDCYKINDMFLWDKGSRKSVLGYFKIGIWPFTILFTMCLLGFCYFVYRYGFVVSMNGGLPRILLLQPEEGYSGSLVTINGTGFAKIDNVVKLAGTVATSVGPLSSPDNYTLQFSVPQLPPGVYQVSVVTGIPGHDESDQRAFTIQ